MRTVSRQALVPQTPAQMYGLVNDINAYPSFVPYCLDAIVLSQSATELSAILTVGRAGIKVSLSTQNTMQPNESIELNLLTGPFKAFTGRWDFKPLGTMPSADRPSEIRGTGVYLEVAFEFENRLLDQLAGALFESTWNTLVDTFVKRARALYPVTLAQTP